MATALLNLCVAASALPGALSVLAVLVVSYLACTGVALFHPSSARRRDARQLLEQHPLSRRRR
ncbi:hypothetical protein [Streptomyces sp. WM6378]|uniref:hypothetical protein n=1 Tax=Streptomyces sp. WM6378 TaxID=1415557 RepID=UPI000B15D616|nr:hypothetical protein [Streptomyces sp. WM6378]